MSILTGLVSILSNKLKCASEGQLLQGLKRHRAGNLTDVREVKQKIRALVGQSSGKERKAGHVKLFRSKYPNVLFM